MRYIFFILFSLLLFFYPGNIPFTDTFAYKKDVLNKKEVRKKIQRKVHIPIVINKKILPNTTAKSVFVCDERTLTPLFKKNINKKMYPASTTKIITALVAYDVFKPYQVITVKKPIQEGELMGLINGEEISVNNVLQGMLIQSGNDAAYVLATAYGYKKFVALMNKKARELKMKNTHFTNPAGLNNPNHYSTAFDLALAAREFLKNKYLSNIVATKEIIVSDVNFKHFHKLTNINKLLGKIKGLGGVKTGYTKEAGENLISLYKKNDKLQYLIVVLKSKDRFKDTQNIINWINNNTKAIEVTLNQ